MERILLVEDEQIYRDLLKKIITEKGYAVVAVDNPISGVEELVRNSYDLVISDLRMKEMDGIRFINTAKTIQENIKTIILTGAPDEESEMDAIDNQVDMYLVKEKGKNVLLKYIDLVLQKEMGNADNSDILRSKVENIMLDKKTHKVFKQEEELELTRIEFELLKLLLENKDKVMTRAEIIEKVWLISAEEVESRIVDVHMKNLRDKLQTFSIVTIRGYGYKWNE